MATVLTGEELAEALEGMQPRLQREIRKRSRSLALLMESRGKENATTRLRVRTGTLRRSVAGFVETGTSGPLQLGVRAGGRLKGKDVPYARLQDLGGTIRPKRVKWLALPDDSVKTGAGVPRYPSPRNYPKPLRFQYIFFGLAALVEDTNQGPKVRWWLRKKTTIPATYFLRDAFRKTAREDVPTTLAGALDAVMPGGGE